MGPPGQAPRGVWGSRGVAPGAELLPRPKLMAQLGDTLLFLQEERLGEVGRRGSEAGTLREERGGGGGGGLEARMDSRHENEASGKTEESPRAKRGQQVKKRHQKRGGPGRESGPCAQIVPTPLTPHRRKRPRTSAMIFSSSRFSFSRSRDFSSSLLLVDEPVFIVSCASDCHSPRVISRRIWGRRVARETVSD